MAGIFYTGGTSGFPKGVMQSHSAIWASGVGSLPMFGMTRESRYLHVAPMFHMADFAGGMGATLSAAQNVVLQSFDPVAVMATVAEKTFSQPKLKTSSSTTLLFRTCQLSASHTMNGVKLCTPLLSCTRAGLRPRKSWSHTAEPALQVIRYPKASPSALSPCRYRAPVKCSKRNLEDRSGKVETGRSISAPKSLEASEAQGRVRL